MRNIVSTWRRKDQVIKRIPYESIDNAIARLGGHVIRKAEPGDVIELTHRVTELHLGTITVRVGGHDTDYLWERPYPQQKTVKKRQ